MFARKYLQIQLWTTSWSLYDAIIIIVEDEYIISWKNWDREIPFQTRQCNIIQLHPSASEEAILLRYIFMFYRGTFIFRQNLALSTPPPILNISFPFSIGGVFIQPKYLNKPNSKHQAQAGVPVAIVIVFCLVKVEEKTWEKRVAVGPKPSAIHI